MQTIKEKFSRKQPILNGWMSEASALKAEVMAKQGFDAITIDLQHGLQDYQQMCQGLYGLRASQIVPMVRVAWNQPDQIMKALDAGALGIICPMINTRAEAEKFASSVFFPPKGERSFGPIRSAVVYDDYYQQTNDKVVGFAMIETQKAVSNLDEILSVATIDGIYIGPSDLSISYGFAPGFDREDEPMLKVIRTILQTGKNHGVMTAIHTDSPQYAIKMIEAGFDMVTLSSDLRAMTLGLQQTIKPFRDRFSR